MKQVGEGYITHNPLDYMVVTQPFAFNLVDFYIKWGLKGHNGIDFRGRIGDNVYAVFDGTVRYSAKNYGGGNMVTIVSDKEVNGVFAQVRYMHLNKRNVEVGAKVKAGDIIGFLGNTGQYTTGQHLHFDLKLIEYRHSLRVVLNLNNGYNGCIDPSPYISKKIGYCEWLPVDERYGRKYSYWAEFKMRFKNPWLHRQLIKKGRDPLSLTQREMIALVYGGYSFNEVMDITMYPVWATLKKVDFKNKKITPIRLGR